MVHKCAKLFRVNSPQDLLLSGVVASSIALLSVLPLDTARPATSEGRLQAEVDVLLRVETDDEGWNVNHLLPHADVSLPDQHPGVVDGLRQPKLEHLSLQPPLEEVLHLEAEHEVEFHLGLVKNSDPDQAAQQCVTLEQALGVLLLECEELPGGGADLGQAVLHPPDLPLVPQSVLANQLQLLVQPGLLEGPAWGGVHLALHSGHASVHHPELQEEPLL